MSTSESTASPSGGVSTGTFPETPSETSFETAIADLFHQRFPALQRYLDRLTGDPDLAADLAQETFVRLYQRGAMPDDPAAWLVSVAMNAWRDVRRRGSRRATLSAEYRDDVVAPRALPAASDVVVADESRARVRRVLDTLSERDRMLLLLRYEGYSYRELANAVGVAETSVGTLLLRATHAFRTTFTALFQESDAALD